MSEALRDQYVADGDPVAVLLGTIELLESIRRRLNPADLAALAGEAQSAASLVREMLAATPRSGWPGFETEDGRRLEAATAHVLSAVAGLSVASTSPRAYPGASRSLRAVTAALELLYPLARVSPAVSRFFIEPQLRDDAEINARLDRVPPAGAIGGVIHVDNDRQERGGYSLYVPEYVDTREPRPLVVALHGGRGHGADFLWMWLREARSRGALLLAPTSHGPSWSIHAPDAEASRIEALVTAVRRQWNVDGNRLLLTGMSDGGTFTLVAGLHEKSPFSHLAPVAAAGQRLQVPGALSGRVGGLPIYLVHGSMDWMFPVPVARMAQALLTAVGAQVVYREIGDLGHAYPREENGRILDWLLAS